MDNQNMVPHRKKRRGQIPNWLGINEYIDELTDRNYIDSKEEIPESCSMFKVDVKESEEEFIILADLPGIKKEDIHLDYDRGYLLISANREQLLEEKKDDYIRRERIIGEVKRCFHIPDVDEDGIDANFKDGVLKIILPKIKLKESSKRKIEIK